jgi:PTS system fructose-specific IIC component
LLAPELRERDTAGVISEMSQILQREGFLADVLPFYQAALNQEMLSNSALECGIALPHARRGGVRQLQFALGRVPEPVSWGTKGSARVQLIFLLAVPATDAACYLQLLASFARLGQQPALLAELRAAADPAAMMAALEKVKVRQGGA